MAQRYQQFLGSAPGSVVELIDDSSSPYLIRTEEGFEFRVAAEDFRSYYRSEGTPTLKRWLPLMTDPDQGTVDSRTMLEVMELIRSFEHAFADFDRTRTFVRDALGITAGDRKLPDEGVRDGLAAAGLAMGNLSDKDLHRLVRIPEEIRNLLMSDWCAVFPLPTGDEDGELPPELPAQPRDAESAPKKSAEKTSGKTTRERMKNVEMTVSGNILAITVDLSRDFGPSKSGKTTIVASTEGNRGVPGREEKIGLNIYRQETKKPATGKRNTFKNVEMSLDGEILLITVDLSQEYGSSKSGKTIIVASTEGNQLVYGRSEKIGLNVYK